MKNEEKALNNLTETLSEGKTIQVLFRETKHAMLSRSCQFMLSRDFRFRVFGLKCAARISTLFSHTTKDNKAIRKTCEKSPSFKEKFF